jgi:Arc/MetJ family transcription regulator
MRITIEIDADSLKRIQHATRQKKKSPAVQLALSEFLKRREREEFVARALSGKTDYSLTNEELEARDVYEAR